MNPPVPNMLSARVRLGIRLTAFLTGVMGLINLYSAVSPSFPRRDEWLSLFLPSSIRAGGNLFAALSGFILLTLAANLLRRKRVAWYLTVGLLIASMISHLLKGLDIEESLFASVLLLQLCLLKKAYTAASDRPSIAQGIRVLITAIFFTLAYGTAGFYVLDGNFHIHGQPINFSFSRSILQTLAMFFTADNAGLEPKTQFASFFAHSIYAVGAATLLFALLMLLRPVLLRGDPSTQHDRRQARQIIDQYGQSSLARLALLPDKAYYFSPSQQSVIAYVAKGRAAIALGDPIGPELDRLETLRCFQLFCAQNDWFPAFYEAVPDQLPLYKSLGYHWVQIGEEAVVDLSCFSLKGKAYQDFRTAINKMTRAGYQFQVYAPPIDDSLMQQLKPVSDEWLAMKQGSEKQFSISWFDPHHLQECFVAVIYNPNGKIVAFSNLLSGYNRSEVTVDLMRYRQGLEKGMMDFLFASMLLHFQAHGYDTFNFSLSPLAGVGSSPDARKVEKGLNYFFKHLNQFYNFKGLHHFKEKFQPTWEARYLVYPSFTVLPDIAVGLVRADSGDRLLDYLRPGT
jgi:phosphatidylglycerol lysyltransferase